jgi:hypothetical protein
MSKDARYNIYAKYRDKAPDKNSSDYNKYNEQKARYTWSLNSLI